MARSFDRSPQPYRPTAPPPWTPPFSSPSSTTAWAGGLELARPLRDLHGADPGCRPLPRLTARRSCAPRRCPLQGNAYAAQRRTRLACIRSGNVVGSVDLLCPLNKANRPRPADDDQRADDLVLDHVAPLGRSVLYLLKHMVMGEIFVPRIRSMRVVDRADAVAPQAPCEVVGLRPGESRTI